MCLRRCRVVALCLPLAVAAAVCAVPSSSAAELTGPDVSISAVTPTNSGGAVTGPFSVTVAVQLHDVPSVDLFPSFGAGINQLYGDGRTVTQAQCPAGCTVSFDFDPTGWDTPVPSGWATASISYRSSTGGGSVSQSVQVADPVGSTWIKAVDRVDTPDVRGYAPYVSDSGVTFTLGSDVQRTAGEAIEARVYPVNAQAPFPTALLTATGSWSTPATDSQPPTGSVQLDTAHLPAGNYPMLIRSRNSGGQYGWSMPSTLTIRHRPVSGLATLPAYLTSDEDLLLHVEVNRPLPDHVTWSKVRVTIDDEAPQTLAAESWDVPSDTAQPVTGSVRLSPTLTSGTHTVTTQVLDADGNPIGQPSSGTVSMVVFHDGATAGALVVGEEGLVQLTGTAPTGMAYQSCSATLTDALAGVSEPKLCTPGATSYSRSVSWTPQASGPSEVATWVSTQQGVVAPEQTTPLTVYAQRSATLKTSGTTTYGRRTQATVLVHDLRQVGTTPVPVNGAEVTLQRKTAGTATWSTLAIGSTDATGRAALSFANDANGRLRATVDSTVPEGHVASAERSLTSVSTVAWGIVPRSAHRRAVIRASVRATPYEKGAKLRLQARRGAGRWTTLRSAATSTSGRATLRFRLSTRGSWKLRVVRAGTTQHATGYSSVKRLTIR